MFLGRFCCFQLIFDVEPEDVKHKKKSKELSNLLEDSKKSGTDNSSKKACSNLFCRNNPFPLKPANSKRHEGKVYWFCPQCLECYNKGFHCDYCEQVYENNESCADVKEWVGCERCFKWNHVDCEAAFRNDNKIKKIYKSKDFKYYCLKCETKKNKKSTNGALPALESPQKLPKGSVLNGQAQQTVSTIQTNSGTSKKTRGNGNNLVNSSYKQSEDSHATEGKQSIEKRKALTPSRRRLQNASTSQVPSENDKGSVDFKPPRNFQNNDNKSDGDSNYYDISIPYKKRKENMNGKGASLPDETYQLFKKKYQMVYPHPSFNFLQYHLHELSFGVKLSLNEETIRSDLDRLRCCVDEEFKAKYDEEMRIKEEHKKKKEEQDLERQKLIQQRKQLLQQRLKLREEQENDGEDNMNGENNSGDADDDDEDDDEDIENKSQQQQPEETELKVRRYATRRHQDLLVENKHKKEHNSNGNDNDQLSGDYHGQKNHDGSQERRVAKKITRGNKRNAPSSSSNHNKHEDSGNNDSSQQKQQSEQKKLENGNQKKFESNNKNDENKQKDDEIKESQIAEGNLSNKEETLQKKQQQAISKQPEQSQQSSNCKVSGKESEDGNGKINEIGKCI